MGKGKSKGLVVVMCLALAACQPTSSGSAHKDSFGNGTYYVGGMFAPGTYVTSGRGRRLCSWSYKTRKGRFFNGAHRGPSRLNIPSTVHYIQFSGGCVWHPA